MRKSTSMNDSAKRTWCFLFLPLLLFLSGQNQCAPDADCDGISDAQDNCPEAYNPFQTDGDGDGIGDVCDPPTLVGEEILQDDDLAPLSLYSSGGNDPSPAAISAMTDRDDAPEGTAFWQVHTGTVRNPGSTYGGFVRSIPTSPLTPGKKYRLSYTAKSLGEEFDFRFSNQNGSGDESALSHTAKITPKWVRYDFVATLDLRKFSLYGWSTPPDQTLWIDDFQLQEVDADTPEGLVMTYLESFCAE